MGATAFRPKKSSRHQYARRKARRLSGKPMATRTHESPPWYTFRLPGKDNPNHVSEDPIMRTERELTKFGEVARYRERFQEAHAGEFPEERRPAPKFRNAPRIKAA